MSYIKPNDEWRMLTSNEKDTATRGILERVQREVLDDAMAGEHDSETCDAANGKPCEMCVAADEYEARKAGKVAKAMPNDLP